MALLESTTENATSSKEVVLTAVPGFFDIQTVGKEGGRKTTDENNKCQGP